MRTEMPHANAAIDTAREDLGRLVLRVSLALLLLHGVSKLLGGVGFITGMLEKMGLPGRLTTGCTSGKSSRRC